MVKTTELKKRGGSFRPNPEGQIIKNWKAKFKAEPGGRIYIYPICHDVLIEKVKKFTIQ